MPRACRVRHRGIAGGGIEGSHRCGDAERSGTIKRKAGEKAEAARVAAQQAMHEANQATEQADAHPDRIEQEIADVKKAMVELAAMPPTIVITELPEVADGAPIHEWLDGILAHKSLGADDRFAVEGAKEPLNQVAHIHRKQAEALKEAAARIGSECSGSIITAWL